VTADETPLASEQFLLRMLVQQVGIALANARLHVRERASASALRTLNTSLGETVTALRRSTEIHDRLTRVALAAEGEEGIAKAVHELTGYPVVVEDRHGNVRAWAGPGRPDPYPKDEPARRAEMLERAVSEAKPVRHGDHLVAVAAPRHDVLGTVALVDPAGSAGEQELVALEHGGTVLAMELARLQSLAETELRLRRDLVEELLAGTDEDSALARARAQGYDLERPHRVVVVQAPSNNGDDTFFHAVRRAARDTRVGSLLVGRAGSVVVLADGDGPWEDFRAAVLEEARCTTCRVGVGDLCARPADFPRSYREAQLALKLQETAGTRDRATAFDELGVYRVLVAGDEDGAVERFARQWLGTLLDYDAAKGSELVGTLSAYLAHGGSYDATATSLSVHRNTLKYRLQRIKEISGHDLSEPDTLFNLQLAVRAWQTVVALRGS
jgi:sugar diacid utilization regulator